MSTDSRNEFDDRDDRQLAGLLVSIDRDTAPVQQDVVDRVTQLGEELFKDPDPACKVQPKQRLELRRRHMLTKVVVASLAIACAIALSLPLHGPASGNIRLGSILDETIASDSLRLKVIRNGLAADVWVRSSRQVRWQETPQRYQIADGDRLWQIDANTNTVQGTNSPWFRDADAKVDLLAMLSIDQQRAAELRAAVDDGITTHNGKRCRIFRVPSKDESQPTVEAFVDLDTNELQSIQAWSSGPRGRAPEAELLLVARNIKVDESQFVVGNSLSTDGRIGKIIDSQGIVTLRPMMNRRWTPVTQQMIVKPGDWLKCDLRGANATTVALTSQSKLIAGPGTLLELQGPRQLKLHRGEVRFETGQGADSQLQLLGPNSAKVTIGPEKTIHYRVSRKGELKEVTKKPVWLAGFEGSSSHESIGSLIANVDGRDVPLTVGFHKVKVEVRDQIARTTIEESFVNHTNRSLEGVFHFPLPQDASISGFGMWINGELIEADVVEKQRAREIYETILRERRDPALLEWSGGNIFKARVFPIQPSSEKRIRIVYTQVLPMRANRFHYTYGLRSELLQKTPLRELSLDVQVHSALPLRSVKCATHPVRLQQTDHSAKLEFDAQEYTPTRDFEVTFEIDSRQRDVVVVPHRRGDDGYFLVQLTPPGRDGNWRRQVLPDGKPLELLLVCDTSASMDSAKRQQQQQFLTSILSSLGPNDRFNVAYCDVDCRWLHDESLQPSNDSIARALKELAERISLGWTNLDRMTESILERANDESHVIYIGDGIVTAGDADPHSFVNRFRQMTTERRQGTFHAVSVGNSFESMVLQAMANVGSGSVRQISGERSPQQVALELLNELAQPGITDLKVDFSGLQIAAVYPKRLPNLSAGTQQILVGRYLPQGNDQSGEIVITGQRNGEIVRYRSRISLADAETGNSFIPRLWARAHLNHLLEQGRSQTVRDRIIAMSEEFHIITPYTSLLVLETDEDRERFGVKRRFQMRDGERFFAEGRGRSNFELLQQQMKRAGDWRLGLRRRILATLNGLGRNTNQFQQLRNNWHAMPYESFSSPIGSMSRSVDFLSSMDGDSNFKGWGFADSKRSLAKSLKEDDSVGNELWDVEEELEDLRSDGLEADRAADFQQVGEKQAPLSAFESDMRGERSMRRERFSLAGGGVPMLGQPVISGQLSGFRSASRQYMANSHYVSWFNALFPTVPAAAPRIDTSPEPDWPEEALAISRRLLQPIAVDSGGLEIHRTTTNIDTRWNRTTGISNRTEMWSPKQWLNLVQAPGIVANIAWCDSKQRGAYSRAFKLGRTRSAQPQDLQSYTPGQRPYATIALHHSFRGFSVTIAKLADNRAVLTFTRHQNHRDTEVRVTIDTSRGVVLQTESLTDGKHYSTTRYSGYKRVLNAWWPGQIETLDGQRRRSSLTTQRVKSLSNDDFQSRLSKETPNTDRSILISKSLPTAREAEAKVAAGSASFEDRLALVLRSSMTQNWNDVLSHVEEMEKLEPNKAGLAWIRASVLIAARRNESARSLLQDQVELLTTRDLADKWVLATHVLNQLTPIVDANEQLRILDRLRPLYNDQPEFASGLRLWLQRRTQALNTLGRMPEVLSSQRNLANDAPWDTAAQISYANYLMRAGEYDASYAWLRQELDREVKRHSYEIEQLRNQYLTQLRGQGRSQDCVTFTKEWIDTEPEHSTAFKAYLDSLWLANQTAEASATAQQWIDAGRTDGKLPQATLQRLNASLNFARGQRYQHNMDWLDPQWLQPLEETVRFFLKSEHHFDIVSGIMNHHRFRDTDQRDRLAAEIAQDLKTNADTIDKARLLVLIGWANDSSLSHEGWSIIAGKLRQRWDAEEDIVQRQAVAEALLKVYSLHFSDNQQLPFMRERIERAARKDHRAYVSTFRIALFTELLQRPWRDEFEAEALSLIPTLANASEPSARLIEQVTFLHRFVDRMLQARFESDMTQLQDTGHPEELTRTEYLKKKAEFHRLAREGVADRLAKYVASARELDPQDDLQDAINRLEPWVHLERIYLDIRLDRKFDEAASHCWKILGETPVTSQQIVTSGDNRNDAVQGVVEEELLRRRAIMTVMYLAARRSAPETLVKHVLDYAERGTQLAGEHGEKWKGYYFSLLVALDRPDALERRLNEWIRTDVSPSPWQLALGRLRAERGQIDAAIQLFETVQRNSQLTPADYLALSNWYLVADRREKHRQAKIEAFKSMEEHHILTWIRSKRRPWNRRDVPLPTELDEDVLFAFQALFEKSNQPQNYVHELREFYTACRDFRLLKMIPDSLTGRTPQQIYPYLKSLKTNLLHELRNEATADSIVERINSIRAHYESAIDRRAFDLFEALIQQQSAQVLNQPGPHIAAAVAALRRAFEHEWQDGEIRQMADLLAALGTIQQTELANERLQQLQKLHSMAQAGTVDRLFVSWHLAHVLFRSHHRRDEALSTMEMAINEFESQLSDGWPTHANEPLEGYTDLLCEVSHFAEAEQLLTKQLETPVNDQQKYWLTRKRNQVYLRALGSDGRVSLGEGLTLYDNLKDHLLTQLDSTNDDNQRRQLVNDTLQLYSTARDKRLGEYREDLRTFAFKILPPILAKQTNNFRSLINDTTSALQRLIGADAALRFLIERIKNYPPRFEYSWENPWSQFGYRLSRFHRDLKGNIGDLEPRLLKLVLAELQRDLRSRHSRNRAFYHKDHGSHFWEAKADDFYRVAEQVLEEGSDSGRSISYVAEYLYRGLHKYNRSLEVLLTAHQNDLLSESQQLVLCDFLHDQNRFAESIPILTGLIEVSPDAMRYRTRLLAAYHKSSRQQQARDLLTETDNHFRAQGRWTEENIAQLAASCLSNTWLEEAAAYYAEVISLHQRTARHRGIGGSTLSDYYMHRAEALSGLGQTVDAVDAAAAAVVAWGPRHEQRQRVVLGLQNVLSQAEDLDDYVNHLDRQAEHGQDSPLIRQRIGFVYATRSQHDKAITQLQLALLMQPTNLETRKKLIESYDAQNDKEEAFKQMLALMDVDRHNLDLYKELADRVSSDDTLAERATTTIVEAAPLEAEHHAALAEVRQKQNRWNEAIDHWQHVAELRRLEPNGLLRLAEAQLHAKHFVAAQETIDKLGQTAWPARFRGVQDKIRDLQSRLRENQ